MRPKQKYSFADDRRCSFPPIILYRPDIESILEIAEKRQFEVLIADENNEFDSLDDVEGNRGSKIKNLDIDLKGVKGSPVKLKISSYGIKLSAPPGDDVLIVWAEIKYLLEQRVPWYAKLMHPYRWLWGIVAILYLGSGLIKNSVAHVVILAALVIFGIMFFLSAIYIQRGGIIYLKKQHEVLGFWAKYGEKIIFSIFAAIIGAGLKTLFDHFAIK